MLARRLRRRPNIESTFVQRVVFAGRAPHLQLFSELRSYALSLLVVQAGQDELRELYDISGAISQICDIISETMILLLTQHWCVFFVGKVRGHNVDLGGRVLEKERT